MTYLPLTTASHQISGSKFTPPDTHWITHQPKKKLLYVQVASREQKDSYTQKKTYNVSSALASILGSQSLLDGPDGPKISPTPYTKIIPSHRERDPHCLGCILGGDGSPMANGDDHGKVY